MKWRLTVLVLTGLCALPHCRLHQYHFISNATPWLKAQMYCRELHTDLATVYNINEMNNLVNTAQDTTRRFKEKAWIGLYENLTSWRWSLSDEDRGSFSDKHKEGNDYRNWDAGQPDNFLGDEMCVNMGSTGGWEDSQCFLKKAFICYDETIRRGQGFIFVEKERSWSDAQLFCRDRYTDLASVTNKEENIEIQRLAKERSVWIGLFRTWEWSDQSDSTYRYWGEGQPDNVLRKLSCAATDLGNAGLWSDEDCSKELSFICYENDMPDFSTTSTAASTTNTTSKTVTTEETSTGTVFTSSSSSTPQKDQTTSVPDETSNQSALTTSEEDSATTEVPNEQSTAEVEPTEGVAEHVIILGAKLTSMVPLSDDDIRDLFNALLTEKGLPSSIKVGLRTKSQNNEEPTERRMKEHINKRV